MTKKSKSKVAKKAEMTPWTDIPDKDLSKWIGEYFVSYMVVTAWTKFKKLPKKIRMPKECLEDLPDGSGLLHYEVEF